MLRSAAELFYETMSNTGQALCPPWSLARAGDVQVSGTDSRARVQNVEQVHAAAGVRDTIGHHCPSFGGAGPARPAIPWITPINMQRRWRRGEGALLT